jgi:ankyrin repeat protein
MTPLHYAVSCEDDEMVQLLVAHGAFTDVKDNDGETPLAAASSPAIETILAQGKTQPTA